MIVRAVDVDNDWLFGKSKNDYRSNKEAIAQNIKTRLQSFLGDCFFDSNAGIDWFNLLGGKNKTALDLAISAVILNTGGVTRIVEISSILSENRVMSSVYAVDTVYGRVSGFVSQGEL